MSANEMDLLAWPLSNYQSPVKYLDSLRDYLRDGERCFNSNYLIKYVLIFMEYLETVFCKVILRFFPVEPTTTFIVPPLLFFCELNIDQNGHLIQVSGEH